MNKFQDNYFGNGRAEIRLAKIFSDNKYIDNKIAVKIARKLCDYKRIINSIHNNKVYNGEQVVEVFYKNFIKEIEEYLLINKHLVYQDINSYIINVATGYKTKIIREIIEEKRKKDSECNKAKNRFLKEMIEFNLDERDFYY